MDPVVGARVKDANDRPLSAGLFLQLHGRAIPRLVTLLSKCITFAGVRVTVGAGTGVDLGGKHKPIDR